MASSEERIDEPATELVHKTKIIQFLGRTTPIILQNDNGPCPLLAICNVLLLKNSLNLSPDIPEVSQEKLLSLVAERLIDSNSNIVDKDSGYVENQQQNIADAIDLLPRLATGIDVNIKFTRIDDFEFTRECAIFDLLDIPLYHGWIVDPQDSDTANAIGLKSYNTLMGELVALETRNMDNEPKKNTGEDSVDFVAATTAALGVPSPCLSRGRSFDDSLPATSDIKKLRKGDMEEEAELLRAMKLSEVNSHILVTDSLPGSSNGHTEPERADLKRSEPVLVEHVQGCVEVESPMSDLLEPSLSAGCNALRKSANEVTAREGCVEVESRMSDLLEPSLSAGCNALRKSANEVTAREVISEEAIRSNTEHIVDLDLSTCQQFEQKVCPSDIQTNTDVSVQNKNVPLHIFEQHPVSSCENRTLESSGGVEVLMPPTSVSDSDIQKPESIQHDSDAAASSGLVKSGADSDSSSGRRPDGDMLEVFSSSADDSEPIYEGEECILESGTRIYEDREPMYEGEVVLAKQGDTVTEDSCNASLKDHVSPRQGELIRTFLKNSASQLTIYGLFCLQGGLKERELCVFFRNNHFNTMFKFEGELYILATDQGYINQPDLVWEKLNEVNGDTVFMTSNFKEFKVEENSANNSWDEQNAVASTTDYIASIDPSANPNSIFNSDLQLAIALQQQEFEQQPQGPQRTVQQPVATSSRLVTGPQVPKQSGRIASSRQEPKSSKDKCNIM